MKLRSTSHPMDQVIWDFQSNLLFINEWAAISN